MNLRRTLLLLIGVVAIMAAIPVVCCVAYTGS